MSKGAEVSLTTSWYPADTSYDVVEYTVGQLLRMRAAENPDRFALVGENYLGVPTRYTYAELLNRAERVASALANLAEPGEKIAFWAPSIVEWPVIQYGAALAGVVLVALNPTLKSEDLDYALGHSGAGVLIYAPKSRSYSLKAIVAEIAPKYSSVRFIELSDEHEWMADRSEVLSQTREPQDAFKPVMLQYTSGTTGKPKGVLLRHRSLVNVGRFLMTHIGVEPGAVVVNPLPMFHSGSCVSGTLGALWLGGTQVIVERFDPAHVLELMRAEQATAMIYVPTMLSALVREQLASDKPAPKLRTLLGGAASVAPSLIEAAETVFGAEVMTVFGQTELSPVVSATRRGDAREDILSTIGRPLPQVDVRIVDTNTGAVLPTGQVGEICARGYQQMIEYYKDPESTKSTIDEDGFVHTGDLGRMDERGYISITGRLKELIIRGGENIAPAEIESHLVAHDEVFEAAVVGLPDEYWGETVAVVLRLAAGTASVGLRDRLVKYLLQKVAPFKVPAKWFVTDEYPQTASGKVKKFELVKQIVEDELDVLL